MPNLKFQFQMDPSGQTSPFETKEKRNHIRKLLNKYSDVSIKNIDILPNRQYIANTADSAQEQYS